MTLVVKDLEFAADGGSRALVHGRIHEILDAAVGPFCNLELDLEDKILVRTCGNDIPTVGGLASVALENLEDAVLDHPSLLRESVQPGSSPSVGCLTVPKEFPSFFLLRRSKDIGLSGYFRSKATVAGKVFFNILGQDTDVAPIGMLAGRDALVHCMDLEGDETLGGHVIPEVGAGHSVQEGADRVTEALQADFVPVILLGRGPGIRIIDQRIEPAAAGFVVDAGRPSPVRRIHFILVTMDHAVIVVLAALTPELDAGISPLIYLVFQFKDEIPIYVFGRKEGAWSPLFRSAADDPVHDLEPCLSAQPLPVLEILPVEKRGPLLRGQGGRTA